jgi:hypothetical protein
MRVGHVWQFVQFQDPGHGHLRRTREPTDRG